MPCVSPLYCTHSLTATPEHTHSVSVMGSAQAYGVCLVPRAVCLVTELLRGGDMYHALRVHPHLMAWNVLGRKVALDIALGLNHLHCQSPPLMHRVR